MLKSVIAFLLAVHCCIAMGDEWGSIRGQIVVDGEIPERQLLISKASGSPSLLAAQ